MRDERDFAPLTSVMDVQGALGRLGDDVELLEQIIQIFLEDAPGLVHAARQAAAKGDAVGLRRSAHSIKGMMGTLGATAGMNAAFRLEQCAAGGDLAEASALIHDCGERVAEVMHALESYVENCDRHRVENAHRSSAAS